MDIIIEVLLGLGLAMDAAAVSIAGGASRKDIKSVAESAALAALFFGGFQAGMLAIGWLGGSWLRSLVSNIDHWVAFGLLGIVGMKMVVESFSRHESKKTNLLDYRVLVALAFATSIDALVVGTGLAFADGGVAMTAAVVGIVTALISAVAVLIGSRYGSLLGEWIEIIGGIVVIGIGLNILASHLMA